jgi:signal transduction histidine kinase
MHDEVLFSHKEDWNYVACRKIDGTGDHLVKWNKPDWERQVSHVLFHMWNLDLKKWMIGM